MDDAYANPNALTVEPIEGIFPSLIGSIIGSSAASGSAYGLAGDALLIGRYIQYWGTNTYTAASTTSANASNYDMMAGTVAVSDNLGSLWGAFYFGQGQNLNRVIQWGAGQGKWDYVGAAQALRGWGWLEMSN